MRSAIDGAAYWCAFGADDDGTAIHGGIATVNHARHPVAKLDLPSAVHPAE